MQLSRADTCYIKGIAILCIALHNFLHLLPPMYPCNEFEFSLQNIITVAEDFSAGKSINILFSFLGYIGIYVFFFLSGYGLAKHQQITGLYAIKRVLKLWKLMIVGVVWYIIINLGNVDYGQIFRKLTLTDNFSLTYIDNISTTWWFLCCLA